MDTSRTSRVLTSGIEGTAVWDTVILGTSFFGV